MTRRDYVAFAAMLADVKPKPVVDRARDKPLWTLWLRIVKKTAMIFEENPHFDRARFYDACGYYDGE